MFKFIALDVRNFWPALYKDTPLAVTSPYGPLASLLLYRTVLEASSDWHWYKKYKMIWLLLLQHEEATINGFTMVCDMTGWTMTHMTHFERREPQIFAAMLQVGEARGGGGNYHT